VLSLLTLAVSVGWIIDANMAVAYGHSSTAGLAMLTPGLLAFISLLPAWGMALLIARQSR
jgi:hypothetical protein